jgi:signal transduction histidine kinase
LNEFFIEQFYILFQGIILFQILFFGIILYYARKKEIIYYGLFLLFNAAYFFINAPHTFLNVDDNLIFESQWYVNVNYLLLTLANVMYLYFIKTIFAESKLLLSKIIRWTITGLMLLFVLFIILPFLGMSRQYIFYSIHLMVLPVSILIYKETNFDKNQNKNLIGYGVFFNVIGTLLTLVMIIRYNSGVRLYSFDEYPLMYMKLGTLFEMIFFQIAIIKNWIQQEKEISSKEIEAKLQIASMRAEISSDLHDDIGSGLSKINLMAFLASSNSSDAAAKTTFSKIGTDTKVILSNLKDIVWSIDQSHDVPFFKDRLSNFIRECKDITQINIKYSYEITDKHLLADIGFHHQIYMIIKETLNNAIKYSEAIHIDIKVSNTQLTIKDDGKGFEKEKIIQGNGIKNIEKRCQKIHAQFEISTGLHQGVSIKINFAPKNQNNCLI